MDLPRNVSGDFSYYELHEKAEKDRWQVIDLPWDKFDPSKVSDVHVQSVKVAAFGELTTFSATRSFMDLFADDPDFTQWLSIWFYEETKHPEILTRWLSFFNEGLDADLLLEGRNIAPMTKSKIEMLSFNMISEITATNLYLHFRREIEEPLLQDITLKLARDEMRHSMGFETYLKTELARAEDPKKALATSLRILWYSVQGAADSKLQHPVFQTLHAMPDLDAQHLAAHSCEQILKRFSKLLGIEMTDTNDVYAALKDARKRGE